MVTLAQALVERQEPPDLIDSDPSLPLRYRWRTLQRCTAALLLAIIIGTGGISARADVRVQGNKLAVRLEASHAPVSEALSALGAVFDVRYRASVPLDREIHGTYTGPLDRVLARVLDGYNYVVKNQDDTIELFVVGRPGHRAIAARRKVSPAVATKAAAQAAPPSDAEWLRQLARHRRPPQKY